MLSNTQFCIRSSDMLSTCFSNSISKTSPKPPLFFRSAFSRGDETAVFLLFNIFFGILEPYIAYLLRDHTAIYPGSIGAFYKPKICYVVMFCETILILPFHKQTSYLHSIFHKRYSFAFRNLRR